MSLWIWNNTFLGAWLIKEKYKQKKISLGKPLRAGWEIFSCPAKSLRFFFHQPSAFQRDHNPMRASMKMKVEQTSRTPPITLLSLCTHGAAGAQQAWGSGLAGLAPQPLPLELLLFRNSIHWPGKNTSMQSHAKKADEGFSHALNSSSESTGPAPSLHFRKFYPNPSIPE